MMKVMMYNPNKKLRHKPEQIEYMELYYEFNPRPNTRARDEIAERIGLDPKAVQVWFQNRRAKTRSHTNQQKPSISTKLPTLSNLLINDDNYLNSDLITNKSLSPVSPTKIELVGNNFASPLSPKDLNINDEPTQRKLPFSIEFLLS